MSASFIKDRAFGIAIFKAPPNLSKEVFENKMTSFVDALLALPIAQNNFLKYDMIFQTGLVNEHLKALGFSEAPPSVWLTAECATEAHFLEILEDPTFANVVQEKGINNLYGSHQTANSFLADVETRLDRPAPEERTRLMCAVQRPENLSTDEFLRKLGDFTHKFVGFPIAQRLLVNLSVWMPNNAIDTQILALGFPAPKPAVVFMLETEHQDSMIEVLMDYDIKQMAMDASRELNVHIGSSVFAANVVTKISK
ncbi:hypothetical protein B0H12DRAFT_1097436 [Mycena haematopus]|nr:hypothetical protein B0H12DRAFT_1097436 [Mycena haematopus]